MKRSENKAEKKDPVLCYVDGVFAYFTTQSLKKQTGDDWNDAPYEHNAGEPYGPCWHNEPKHRNDPKGNRGWKPGTKTPIEVGELCQCASCKRDWNKDGTPKWEIVKVAFTGDLDPPCEGHLNSPFSVDQINDKRVPWLSSPIYIRANIKIWAGTPISKFKELVRKSGGKIYVEETT
jgi:hypothetical protein